MNENKTPICCPYCGCVLDEWTHQDPDGDPCCDECFEDRFFYCECCDAVEDRDNGVYIADTAEFICEDCAERSGNYFCCQDCGKWYSERKLSLYDDNCCICTYCEDDWRECETCSCLFHINSGYYDEYSCEWFCYDCYEERPRRSINDYSYKPFPNFLTTTDDHSGARFYGIELEVDDGHDANDCAADIAADTASVYMKHDGSLNTGFEIVTHPATLRYHMQRLPWKQITDICRDYSFKSHDTTTCGLHIHIGREELPEDTPEKLLIVFEKLWPQLVRFSRRTENALQSWARCPEFDAQPTDCAATLKEKAYKHRGKGRYQAVNLTNRNTIEIRIFRGTLKHTSIIAALQLLDTILDYCEAHTAAELMQTTWADITRSDFAELRTYLAERGL